MTKRGRYHPVLAKAARERLPESEVCMTRVHFQRAAEIVRATRDVRDNLDANDVRAVWTAEAFILLFQQFNPRFDEQRFLQACGLVPKPERKRRTA